MGFLLLLYRRGAPGPGAYPDAGVLRGWRQLLFFSPFIAPLGPTPDSPLSNLQLVGRKSLVHLMDHTVSSAESDPLPSLKRGASPFSEGDCPLQGLQFGAVHPYGPIGARARPSMRQRGPPRFRDGHRGTVSRSRLQSPRLCGGRLSGGVFITCAFGCAYLQRTWGVGVSPHLPH
jgi:hypothetical protein